METTNSTPKNFFLNSGDSVRLDISVKDRVKILLRRKGISQNQLADRVEINKATMSQIVNGLWIPTSNVMLRIAAELDCDSIVIFGDTDYWKAWREKTIYPEEEKNAN